MIWIVLLMCLCLVAVAFLALMLHDQMRTAMFRLQRENARLRGACADWARDYNAVAARLDERRERSATRRKRPTTRRHRFANRAAWSRRSR